MKAKTIIRKEFQISLTEEEMNEAVRIVRNGCHNNALGFIQDIVGSVGFNENNFPKIHEEIR